MATIFAKQIQDIKEPRALQGASVSRGPRALKGCEVIKVNLGKMVLGVPKDPPDGQGQQETLVLVEQRGFE